MGIALQPADRLRWRLPSFQRKLARSAELIAQALEACPSWYVALSGGKDSLVTLALVARQYPQVSAIWVDDELEYPEQEEYIPALCRQLGVRLIIKTGTQLHAEWFRPWTEAPFFRDPLPGTVITRESVRVLAPRWGFGGVFLGLRTSEAWRRRIHLARRGPLHQSAHGWQCSPCAGWTTDDVWAAIAGLELPYNPVYDRLAEIGVPREQQRVGPLPLSDGWKLRVGWPELYERLVARYGRRWVD